MKAKKSAEAEAGAKAEKDEAKAERSARSARPRETATDRLVKNMAGSVGRSIGNALVRGVLGNLLRF